MWKKKNVTLKQVYILEQKGCCGDKRKQIFLVCHIIMLLTEPSRSVLENLELAQILLRLDCTHDLGQDSPILISYSANKS